MSKLILYAVALLSFLSFVQASNFNKTYYESTTPGYSFVVPLGVFSLDFFVEGYNNGFAASGSVSVNPNDQIHVTIGGASTTCGGQASYVTDGTNILLLAAGGDSSSGSSFTVANANAGEGFDGECGSLSYYDGSMVGIGAEFSTGIAMVRISWEQTCSENYDALHSDYNPTLLSTSSLYIRDNIGILALDIALPVYYYDVTFDFKNQCGGNLPNQWVETIGCMNHFYTAIDYNSYCSFDYSPDAQNPDFMLYSGELRVNASLDLEIAAGWNVVRALSSPIQWRVQLQQTITVSSEVQVVNNDVCTTSSDCNGNGCCVEGQCDCECPTFANGFGGVYCHVDIEPPTSDVESQTYNLYSNRGGCMDLTSLLANAPEFQDNLAVTSVSRTLNIAGADGIVTDVLDTANDDLLSVCFPIANGHTVSYVAADAAGNSKIVNLIVNVYDRSNPVVDCAGCQAGYTSSEMAICHGTTDLVTPFEKIVISKSDMGSHMSIQHSNGRYADAAPGQMIDMTIHYGNGNLVATGAEYSSVYLNCDCQLEFVAQPEYPVITNSWMSWGAIGAVDPSDDNLVITHDTTTISSAGDVDGIFNVIYTATDDDGNVGTCSLLVTYDTTPPTCDGWYSSVTVDPNNLNYTLPISFVDPTFNADISGLLSSDFLPIRTQNDIYWIGYESSKNYTSTYTLTDKAGNVGTCEWKLHITNPTPCVWPACNPDDLPPYVEYCPSDISITCADTENCGGCGGWDEPIFGDDKPLSPAYQSHQSTDILSLGTTEVTYTVTDITGQSAQCVFHVTIADKAAPVYTACPTNVQIGTGSDNVADYLYSFSAADSCPLNTDLTFDTTSFPLIPSLVNGQPSGSETLQVGNHGFSYSATDSSGNVAVCSWNVEVVDNHPPSIQCPNDIVQRIPYPSLSSIPVTFFATGTDNVDTALTFTYSALSGSEFTEGVHTITANAIDDFDNWSSCDFTITILPSYGNPNMDAVLTKAVVKELSDGIFGAQLEFVTVVSPYHRLVSSESLSQDALSDPREKYAECGLTDGDCYQTWSVVVSFDGCELINGEYVFRFQSECRPGDCLIDNQFFDITITLSASNYCWQDLANVELSATLRLTSATGHSAFLSDYDAGSQPQMGDALYPIVSVFYNDQTIAGVIEVNSPQVFTSNIKIIEATKEFFSDAEFTTSVASSPLMTNYVAEEGVSATERATLATFSYVENDIPLESTYFVRYVATVEIEYDLGIRRRLLQLDFTEQVGRDLLQSSNGNTQNEMAESSALVLSEPLVGVITDPDNGVVIISIDNCHENDNQELNEWFSLTIADFLRIVPSRVEVATKSNGIGQCLMQIQITEINCEDVLPVSVLIDDLEEGVYDIFSNFHDIINNSPDIPRDVSLNPTVFFVAQTPSSTTPAIESDISSATGKGFNFTWWMYAAAGIAAGLLLAVIFYNVRNIIRRKNIAKALSPRRQTGGSLSKQEYLMDVQRRSSTIPAQVMVFAADVEDEELDDATNILVEA